MSIARIDQGNTHGWQARAHVRKGVPRLTMLCSDLDCGGRNEALRVAHAAEQLLQLRALIKRRQLAREGLNGLIKGPRYG